MSGTPGRTCSLCSGSRPARAGAFVVGEDLGTVEDDVREALHQSGVLSYRIFWFEATPPNDWPHQALGAMIHSRPADDRRRVVRVRHARPAGRWPPPQRGG